MRYKTLLITGGAGFIGSNLAVYFKRKYSQLKVIALDNLIRRGSELNLPRLKENGIRFIRGDIRRPKDLVLDFKPDLMIESSAEPSVMAGYSDPKYIIDTNLMGTVNCLEACRRYKTDIIFLSTSRVYPYQEINKVKRTETVSRFEWRLRGIDEAFTINGPKTLYGATKLSSEMLLREYAEDFGIKGVINRCGVIAGPWQFGKVDQGVFTYWMLAHYFKRPLKYIGFGAKGKQVRDLLHVDDLCNLIDLQVKSLNKINGSVYNVGGSRASSLSLLETTELCRKITGNKVSIGRELKNRPGDIAVYLSDNTKVNKDLKWQPKQPVKSILGDIFRWIRSQEKGLRKL